MAVDNGVRRWLRRIAAAQFIMIAAMTFAFWLLQQQQELLKAEQQERMRVVCEAAVNSRANEIVSAELIISAAEANEPPNAERQAAVNRYRKLQNRVWLSAVPVTCESVMSLREFKQRANVIVEDMLDEITRSTINGVS